MNKLFRPLFALLLLIPVALILALQTIAAPQADEDQGIDRRRRLLEQQAERLERAVENAIESDTPEAIQVRRNLHNQLKAIHLKLDELALFSNADDREREKHLRAALEHLQGAGLSREAARHAIGEALRMQESHEHRDRDHRREDRHDHEHGDHDKDDKRGRDKDEERRYHDDDDDEEDHLRVHHQTATQLEALRREVEELRQLIKRMAARR